MRATLPTLVIALAVMLGGAGCAGASVEAVASTALEIELRARTLEPGEPVRIVVRLPEPVSSVEGSFLGDSVFFARTMDAPSSGTEWSGWAMIGLDREAGAGETSVTARTPDGRTLSGSRRVEVIAKTFPVQRLKVDRKYVTPPPEIQKRIDRERERLTEIYGRRRPIPPAVDPFVRPVPGKRTGVFGTRRFFNDEPRSPHPGLDLRASTGTPVRSSGAGVVVLAEDLYYSGHTVIVDHGGGLFTLYAHLSSTGVSEGERVETGGLVGKSGATGRVTGPHLHWGAKLGDRPFDPTALLERVLFR